jgi:hypothetical protein
MSVNVTTTATSSSAAIRHSAAVAAVIVVRLYSLLYIIDIIISHVCAWRGAFTYLSPNRPLFHTPAPTHTFS